MATIKPIEHDAQAGRYIVMQGPHRFFAKFYTLKLLIAAAYDLNSKEISGGPSWMDTQHLNVEAVTPGEAKPDRKQQMAMLRDLLGTRFGLQFHREEKQFLLISCL